MSEPEAEAGGGGSFWTSGPALIGAFATLITAVTGLIVGLNQAGIIGGGNGGSDTVASAETEAEAEEDGPGAAALFTANETNRGSVYFEGKTMYLTALEQGKPLVVPADKGDSLRDVAVAVRARRDSGAERYSVALMCRYSGRKRYYFFAVWNDGRYRIVKYDGGGPRMLDEGSLPTGERDDEDAIEARCVDDDPTTLTLVVNDEEVTHEDEDGLQSGLVGIRVGTDVDGTPVTVRFDDVAVRPL